MDPDEKKRIEELAAQGMKIRAIARKLGRNVKTIRRVLDRPPERPAEPKLAKYKELALELWDKGLFVPRILRELKARGYTGSRTILGEFLRAERGPRKKSRKVYRRFETGPALEGQVDWSPYRVPIAGVLTLVHCFAMVLCYSRLLFIAFYRNEKLPTLLHAHVEAFHYLGGVCRKLVYDNMATVCLGRPRGKPLWNPAFLQFARHYGFTPWVCKVNDPDRKGKIERPFHFIETDFLRASAFESWDDLNQKAREWLDTVANRRLHSTTRRVPVEAFEEERPLLIELPSIEYPTGQVTVRKVQQDGYIPVDGSLYPVPENLVGSNVTVRVYPARIEILDQRGAVVAVHKVPDRPMRLPADWGPPLPADESPSRSAMEARFLAWFPGAEDFLEKLHLRMKSLLPIHLRQIERLVELYGVERVGAAVDRARSYGNYSALAVRRILEAIYPDVVPEPPVAPVNTGPIALAALDGVESGSPEDYTLDSDEPTQEAEDDAVEEKE
jgi:transposase